MASHLCLHSTVLDAKSEEVSPCLFSGEGILKKPKPSEEVLAMLKITSISLVRFTLKSKENIRWKNTLVTI